MNSATVAPTSETEEEHKKKLEEKGHKEWALVKNAVKADAKFHHRHKHKIIGGTFLVVVAVVVIIVLTVAIAAVAFIYNRNQSADERARDAATASAAVKIGTISVVPPKEEAADGSRRRILGTASLFKTLSQITDKRKFRGLADSDEIDVSTFAVDSDYNTATKSEYVEDGLGEALQIPNMILCMLSQTNADLFMTLEGNDQEPYIANVDESKCDMGGGGEGNNGPRMTPWTIVATVPSKEACDTNDQGEKVNCDQVPSDSGKIHVHAWLLINSGAQELEFKLEVEKSTLVIREDGSFKINDLQIQFKEVVEEENPQSIAGVIKYNTKGDTSLFGYYFSMGSAITAESTVTTDADGNSAESGWAKASVVSYDYQTGQPSTNVMEVSWNGDSLNFNDDACLNRKDYVPIGDSYTLFDSKGKRVHVQSHYRISKVLDADVTVSVTSWQTQETTSHTLKKGKTVEGGISGWGIYFDAWDHEAQEMQFSWEVADEFSKEIFQDGATVMVDLNDGSEPMKASLQVATGRMYGEVSKKVPLTKLKGTKLYTRLRDVCPSNTLNAGQNIRGTVQLKINSGNKLAKVKKSSDYYAECDFPFGYVNCYSSDDVLNIENCTEAILNPTFSSMTEEAVVIPDGTAAHDYDWGLEVFSPSFEGSGRIYPASENPKQDIIISEGGVLSPSKDGVMKTLKCRGMCVNASKLNTNDYYFFTENTRSSFPTYKYNEKTGRLFDDVGNQIYKEGESLHLMLMEDNAKTWKDLGCDASVSAACGWKEPSVKYYWSTGDWSRTVSAKKTADSIVITPSMPIKLELEFPSEFNLRTLSEVNYANKVVTFTYENGWIDGLPVACFDRDNFAFSEAKTKYNGYEFRFSCPSAMSSLPDMMLPDGVPVTSTSLNGKETKYILKAKAVRQMLKPQASSSCSSIEGAPATAVLPTADDIGELDMTDKPSEDGLKIKVEGGEVKAEYLPESESDSESD